MSGEIIVRKVNKLRIFLSYGHDANEELVRMIKADMGKRGHGEWFGKNENKFEDDWRKTITKYNFLRSLTELNMKQVEIN
jgi:hypothetical protein